MAISKHEPKLPSPERLKPSSARLSLADVDLPSRSEINPEQIDFVLDVDLDQLSVFFGDVSRPYSIDEVEGDILVAISEDTDEVIGVLLDRFLTRTIRLYPELMSVLRLSTVIAGESVLDPRHHVLNSANQPKADPMSRLFDWTRTHVYERERREAFAAFADLIGIH